MATGDGVKKFQPLSGVLKGWDEIDDYMSKPRGTMIRKHGEEMRKLGVVYYTYEGRPQKLRVCALLSVFDRWVLLKAQRGELI